MDLALVGGGYRAGEPQTSGAMSVVPLFGEDTNGRIPPPQTGLKLSQVKGYGNLELENPSREGVAIVPLHMGYIQDQAQNHALCRSAFIGAGQKLLFKDACCVQQGQGGYLTEREQWFFVLPASLRETALALRGQVGHGKLWPAIAELNARLGMEERGHLEQIVSRQKWYLTQYASRFELLPGQTGALFYLGKKLVGLEVGPSAAWFAEVFTPLVSFCYGTEAMSLERKRRPRAAPALEGKSLAALRKSLEARRAARREELLEGVLAMTKEKFETKAEEKWVDLELSTVTSEGFAGQVVKEGEKLLYASVTARKRSFAG